MFGQRSDDSDQLDNGGVTENTAASATAASDDHSWQHPGEPLDAPPTPAENIVHPSTPAPEEHHTAPTIQPPATTPVSPQLPNDDTSDKKSEDSDLVDLSSQELVEIKQKALGQLSPLMDHLDQTPEEKFKTTMMLIQASDDQGLVKQAYEAAQSITDDKARARALLDIVNEINYFTQQQNS